jgi:hypothetical protein
VQLRLALACLLAAGCTNQTGIEVRVGAAAGASVASLEFFVSHESYCERQVADPAIGAGTRVSVAGRDLHDKPYELLIHPTHFTNLEQPVLIIAVALDANGRPIGDANFGAHPFVRGEVNEYSADLGFFTRTDASYVSADGCACIPGEPRVGNGSGVGCDLDVVPSFDRFLDTAGCELDPGRRDLTGPVCDGHLYLTEAADRRLPCYNAGDGTCRVGLRNCADHDGFGYDAECVPQAGDPALPSGKLCDDYAGCEQNACGDLIGCFLGANTVAHNLTCKLFVSDQLMPCSGGKWETIVPVTSAATGASCVAAMVEGRIQPPLTVGFKDPAATGSRTRSTLCPPTLVVESIATDPALPASMTLVMTVGDQVINVKLQIIRSCEQVTASLTCG